MEEVIGNTHLENLYNTTYINEALHNNAYSWEENLNSVVEKIEGLAHAFISELSDLKHFIEGEESKILEKLNEWK